MSKIISKNINLRSNSTKPARAQVRSNLSPKFSAIRTQSVKEVLRMSAWPELRWWTVWALAFARPIPTIPQTVHSYPTPLGFVIVCRSVPHCDAQRLLWGCFNPLDLSLPWQKNQPLQYYVAKAKKNLVYYLDLN